MNRKLLALALAVLLLFAASGIAEGAQEDAPALVGVYNATETPTVRVHLRVLTAEGETLLDGMVAVVAQAPTAYMALRAGLDEAGIPIELIDEATPENMFINSIADLASENPYFWMYFINGEMAQLGIGTQEIAEGDLLELIYEDYNLGYVEIP